MLRKLQEDLKTWRPRLRVLRDWDVELDDGSGEYKDQVVVNEKKKCLYIYHPRLYTEDYIFHELLHGAIRAVKGSKELEERLVQDICSQLFTVF